MFVSFVIQKTKKNVLSHGIKVNTEKHFDSLITEPEKMTRVKTKMEKPQQTTGTGVRVHHAKAPVNRRGCTGPK